MRIELRGVGALLVVAVIASGVACSSASTAISANSSAATRAEIVAALERYVEASRAVDPARIAACYASDGELFEPGIAPVKGREAIEAFVASFPGVRVDVATATPDVVELFGDTALIWGSYHEELAFPGQPASAQDGRFVMELVRRGADGWRIQRLFRVPLITALFENLEGDTRASSQVRRPESARLRRSA